MLKLPLVILLEKDGAEEAVNAVLVGEVADNLGAAPDLLAGVSSNWSSVITIGV